MRERESPQPGTLSPDQADVHMTKPYHYCQAQGHLSIPQVITLGYKRLYLVDTPTTTRLRLGTKRI